MIDVLFFAKAPRPGTVKTRLAASIGEEAAVALYRVIGRQIIDQIRPVSNVTVYYDPPDALLEAREWLGRGGVPASIGWVTWRQVDCSSS